MSVPDAHAALREHFGFAAFRPGQEEAVRAALAGRDVLVVMPTGAGKSLCYQLPALMGEDLTLVVSPLVSLMQDQVQALARRAPGRVALVTAQQTAGENEAAVAAAVRGDVRVLYVAPERFSSPGFARALKAARVGLFVVDEAHCVSQWGHDFRPDYFRLADAARWLGARSIVASTATATPSVAADIVTRLGLRQPARVLTGFDRPNLAWSVVRSGPGEQERQLVAVLSQAGATPAIVYAGTRRAVDALAEALEGALDRPVLAYHAGLERRERAAAQERFMSGAVDVVVATNAFGMGVDKADVRTVVHATVPPSVEAYYQEAGRAGRDGAPARAVLLAAERDKGLHVHFIKRAEVTEEHLEAIAVRLEVAAGGAPLPGFAATAPTYDVGAAELAGDGEADRVKAVVGALARAGVVQPAPAAVDRVRGRLLTAF
ncbi:MAG: RecQ family ATP-dependent helicase, partial [Solirubrobacterales bacterium]|nr:RecQ family ATP-dependent helicase [Solirubrobacterales bacterium]